MATEPQIPDSSRSSSSQTIFIDTNLDTNLAMIVSEDDTVRDLKSKLMIEHSRCFPILGKINVSALKVKCKTRFYHLSDGMPVLRAFVGVKRALFLHAEAVPEEVTPVIALNGSVGETERNKLCIDYPSGGLSNLDDSLLPQVRSSELGNQFVLFDGQRGTGNTVGESMKGVSLKGLDVIKENDKPSSSNANEKRLESEVPQMDGVVGGGKDFSKTDEQFKIYNKSKKRARESHCDGVVEDATKSWSFPNKEKNNIPLQDEGEGTLIPCLTLKGDDIAAEQSLSDKKKNMAAEQANETMQGETIESSVNIRKEASKPTMTAEGTKGKKPKKRHTPSAKGSSLSLVEEPENRLGDAIMSTHKDNEHGNNNATNNLIHEPEKEDGVHVAAEEANPNMAVEIDGCNLENRNEALEPRMTSKGSKAKRTKKHQPTTARGPSSSLVGEPVNSPGDVIVSAWKDDTLGNDNTSRDPMHKAEKEDRVSLLRHENHIGGEQANETMAVETDGSIGNVDCRKGALEGTMTLKNTKTKRSKKHQTSSAKASTPSFGEEPGNFPVDAIMSTDTGGGLGNDNEGTHLICKTAEEGKVAPAQRGGYVAAEETNENTIGGCTLSGKKEPLEPTITTKETKSKGSKVRQTRSAASPSPSLVEEPKNCRGDVVMSTDKDNEFGNENTITNPIDIVVPLNKDPKVLSAPADKKERKKPKKSKAADAKGFVLPSFAASGYVTGVANLPRSMPDKDLGCVQPLNTNEEEAVSFQSEKTKISSVAGGNNGNVGTILSDDTLKKDDHKIKKKSKKNKISETKSHALSTEVGNTNADAVNPSRVNRVNAYVDGHIASVQLPTETMGEIVTPGGGFVVGTNNDNQIDGMEVDGTLTQKEVKVPFKYLKRPRSGKKVLADKLLGMNPESSDQRRTLDTKGSSQLITNDLHDDKDGPAIAGSVDKSANDMDSNKINFRDYFVSPKDIHVVGSSAKGALDGESHITRKKGKETKAVKKNQQLVVKPIEKTNARSTLTDQTFDQREVLDVFLPIDSRRKIPDASEALGSRHLANSNSASGAKSKLSLKEHNAAWETFGSSTESSEDREKRKNGKIEMLPQANHHRGAVGKTSKSRGIVANGSNKKESLLATPKTIFKDSSEESSEVDSEVNSDASTKTPDNSSSDYSEGENVTDPNTPSPRTGAISNDVKRKEDDGKHMKEPKRSFDPKNMALDMLIRGSSSYKKAKLSASQLDDSEPVDFVPESEP